jgi:hypothetical protein
LGVAGFANEPTIFWGVSRLKHGIEVRGEMKFIVGPGAVVRISQLAAFARARKNLERSAHDLCHFVDIAV